MTATGDPYYNRKRVPDDFVEHVGFTGLTPTEEIQNRERKFSSDKGDLRKFWNPKTEGKLDPYYQRKPVPSNLIKDVGYTGLTKEEEYLNRERKYSVNGADVRRFSNSTKSGLYPTDDPYYGRKSVDKSQIIGIGESGMSRAEEFETRENKASLVNFSEDPFQQLSGRGHRASVSGPTVSAAAGEARRRSSAVAPDQALAARQATLHHSGYDGGNTLGPIESRREEEDAITPSTSATGAVNHGPTTTTSHVGGIGNNITSMPVAVKDNTGHEIGPTGHTTFYDAATRELASHERE
ncbi:hypothetical protein H2198_008717 [Neophaeococcomyces mojaviensis]|uniref:Uncharacterized protein n=1 Tax=Neophaeococcomyces mojaviensis TaxID=3383035 RepID=A0ACC2ZWM7_9EURO|nr:hypothetical protein H2198_008717 [Knufia sp. JES_112]